MELTATEKPLSVSAPPNWLHEPLGHHVRITSGASPSLMVFDHDGHPYFKVEQLRSGLKYLDSSSTPYHVLGEPMVQQGSVIFAKRGAAIALNKVRLLNAPSSMDTNLMALTPDESLDAEFLFYALTHMGLWRLADTTSVPQINNKHIKPILFPLPGMKEQRAIAEALSDVDGLIGALEKLIAKKRDIKQAAMQQLLTGKTRLTGFDEEWTLTRLGEHLTFLSHGTHSRAELMSDGLVKNLHYGDIHASTVAMLHPTALPSLPVEKAKGLDRLCDGDLVFADASEDLAGVSKSVEICGVENTELVAGLHTITVRFDKNILADGFKAYLQFCPAFYGHLRRLAAGTKVYATNRAHIASVDMWLPSTDEQNAIAAVLSEMDKEIEALEARRDKTKQIKQGMMQSLLMGRVRLMKGKS